MIVRRHNRRRGDRLGFTLMEVLVVVAILVILAGTASVFVFKYLDESKVNRAQADMQALTTACKAYRLKNSEWPASLDVLINPDDNSKEPYMSGGQQALTDPWDRLYQYDASGTNNGGRQPDIFTTTPDGETIGNWERARQH